MKVIDTKKEAYEWVENAFWGDLDKEGKIENLKYMVDFIFRGIDQKDPLHRVNSIIRDYCLKREFDKRFPNEVSWFNVQILCEAKDQRVLWVRPKVKDSFFENQYFEGKTTDEMFNKAIAHYEKRIKG